LAQVAQLEARSLPVENPGAAAQPKPQIQSDGVIGEVLNVDKQASTATIKTDHGATLMVKAAEPTICLRLAAGQTTLANATSIKFNDIGVGDRVLGRGRLTEDKKQFEAQRLIVLPKSEVEKKRDRDLEEWRRRGLGGVVRQINPETAEITVDANGAEGASAVVITVQKCEFWRYAPGSMKFADARTSNLNEVKVGDQFKALGDRSSDGKNLKAEQIIFGSFNTIGATVVEVNAERNEIKATTLDQKRPVIISIGKDSVLHRIPPPLAAEIAKRVLAASVAAQTLQATSQSTGAQKASQPASSQKAAQAPSAPNSAPAENGGQKAVPAQRPKSIDVQRTIDALPVLTLADVKAGDVIAVTSAAEKTDSRISAVKLVTGIDGVLNALKASGGKKQLIGLSAGLPAVFDFSVVQP